MLAVGFKRCFDQWVRAVTVADGEDAVVAVEQELIQSMLIRLSVFAEQAGAEVVATGVVEGFRGDVMIKRMKPFVGEAACPGVFSECELAGIGYVVGRDTGAAADAELQAEGFA